MLYLLKKLTKMENWLMILLHMAICFLIRDNSQRSQFKNTDHPRMILLKWNLITVNLLVVACHRIFINLSKKKFYSVPLKKNSIINRGLQDGSKDDLMLVLKGLRSYFKVVLLAPSFCICSQNYLEIGPESC